MDSMTVWLVIGAAVVIAGISVMLLQKKAGEASRYLDELKTLRGQFDETNRAILEAERGREIAVREAEGKAEELSSALHAEKENNARLSEELENLKTFQAVQSDSLEKIEIELSEVKNQLHETESQRDERAAEAAELVRKAADLKQAGADRSGLEEELAAVKAKLAGTVEKLAAAKKDFEEQMDEVVQSSMEKLNHAELAKEEAIQAAQDNFEAAAEANARLKKAQALLKTYQKT